MSKVKLSAILKGSEGILKTKTIGIKSGNKITYKENNKIVTILIYNNKIEMNRLCDEYKINLVFEQSKNTISTYTELSMNKELKLNTKCNRLEISNFNIKIEYVLEDNNFLYELKIGE